MVGCSRTQEPLIAMNKTNLKTSEYPLQVILVDFHLSNVSYYSINRYEVRYVEVNCLSEIQAISRLLELRVSCTVLIILQMVVLTNNVLCLSRMFAVCLWSALCFKLVYVR